MPGLGALEFIEVLVYEVRVLVSGLVLSGWWGLELMVHGTALRTVLAGVGTPVGRSRGGDVVAELRVCI